MQPSHLLLASPVLLFAACAAPSTEASTPTEAAQRGAPPHERPIVEKEGRTLLWANDSEWFDMTGATINPASFQYGIGKDRIASIDEPIFVGKQDPLFATSTLDMQTPVLGVLQEGVAKAYPVFLMDRHEIVNDEFGGQAYAVLW